MDQPVTGDAAARRCPGWTLVGLVGDRGALKTSGEYAVAVARGASVKMLRPDNASYASIRIHPEHAHPGRVSGTTLANPEFLRWCEAFRVPVLAAETEAELPALAAAIHAPGPTAAVIHTALQAALR